jgi:hypothetical protein
MGQKVVECQYPAGVCDWTVTGDHTNTGEGPECGACGATPDDYEEWRPNDGKCSHDYCIEVAGYRKEYDGRDGSIEADDDEARIQAEDDIIREEWAEYLDWQRSLGAVN